MFLKIFQNFLYATVEKSHVFHVITCSKKLHVFHENISIVLYATKNSLINTFTQLLVPLLLYSCHKQ